MLYPKDLVLLIKAPALSTRPAYCPTRKQRQRPRPGLGTLLVAEVRASEIDIPKVLFRVYGFTGLGVRV